MTIEKLIAEKMHSIFSEDGYKSPMDIFDFFTLTCSCHIDMRRLDNELSVYGEIDWSKSIFNTDILEKYIIAYNSLPIADISYNWQFGSCISTKPSRWGYPYSPKKIFRRISEFVNFLGEDVTWSFSKERFEPFHNDIPKSDEYEDKAEVSKSQICKMKSSMEQQSEPVMGELYSSWSPAQLCYLQANKEVDKVLVRTEDPIQLLNTHTGSVYDVASLGVSDKIVVITDKPELDWVDLGDIEFSYHHIRDIWFCREISCRYKVFIQKEEKRIVDMMLYWKENFEEKELIHALAHYPDLKLGTPSDLLNCMKYYEVDESVLKHWTSKVVEQSVLQQLTDK